MKTEIKNKHLSHCLALFAACLCTATTAAMALTPPPASAAADAAWQRVEAAMTKLRRPGTMPSPQAATLARIQNAAPEFEAARTEFLRSAPEDPRRWDLRLFEIQVIGERDIAGLPAAELDHKKLHAELSAAKDLNEELKAGIATAALLVEARRAERPGGDVDAWIRLAERHLKVWPPKESINSISMKLAAMKTQADLDSKSLTLKFKALDGRQVNLASMRGKVVLVDFWATWCGPCIAELPNILKTYNELHSRGFEVIGISLDSDKAKLQQFVKERALPWPQYFDGKGWQNEISSRHGIRAIPSMWLINKKGRVVSTNARGSLDADVLKLLEE